MPMQDDTVSLVIAGRAYRQWTSYRIDSDFLKPSDAWQLQLGLTEPAFPVDITRGVVVRLQLGGQIILSGRIDAVRRSVTRQGYTLTLAGRDDAAILVDCAAPIFTANQLTLDEVVAKIVRPLGITKIRIQASDAPRDDKVAIEPGCRAWEALQKAAAGRGLWPWMEPDGTLVVGGPDYNADVVDTLVLRVNGEGNNVLTLEETRSINGCYSELTILAQGHARSADSKNLAILPITKSIPVDIWDDSGRVMALDDIDDDIDLITQTGTHNLRATAKDPTVEYYRPAVFTVGDATSQEQMDYRAKKKMADARLSGWDISAEVAGHRTAAGVLWEPGQRVRIISEPHDIDTTFFLMGREFRGGRSGKTTQLRFKEDGVWIPDAFPRNKKRKGRKNNRGVAIVDVWSK